MRKLANCQSYLLNIIAAVICLQGYAVADATYIVTALASLPGGTGGIASAINNSGQVAGHANPDHLVVVWSPSGAIQNSIAHSPDAYAISDSGAVVGDALFSGYGVLKHASLWTSQNGLQDLGTLPGYIASVAYDINNLGQIVGASETHAFLYTALGGMVDIGTLGGRTANALGINDSGVVVGYSTDSSGRQYAFSYTTSGGMKSLGKLSLLDSGSSATAINNLGQIVGNSGGKAFRYSDSTGMVNIGLFAGALNGYPQDINENGEIVGYSNVQLEVGYGNRAFYYSPLTGAVDLNTLIDPASGWTLIEATGINNLGQICGYGTNPSGQTEAFLLTPVPEPATLTLLAVGAAALLRRRRGS